MIPPCPEQQPLQSAKLVEGNKRRKNRRRKNERQLIRTPCPLISKKESWMLNLRISFYKVISGLSDLDIKEENTEYLKLLAQYLRKRLCLEDSFLLSP